MVLEVTYDLHNPGRDYDAVIQQLKTASGGWAHPQGSVWLIDTMNDPSWWVDQLRSCGDPNDEYLVTRVENREWASFGMDAEVVAWLKSSNRRW
jgi:hypothetical protein